MQQFQWLFFFFFLPVWPTSSASPGDSNLDSDENWAVRVRGPYTCELKCWQFRTINTKSKISHCQECIIPSQIPFISDIPLIHKT